jgi:hypothetical protein
MRLWPDVHVKDSFQGGRMSDEKIEEIREKMRDLR